MTEINEMPAARAARLRAEREAQLVELDALATKLDRSIRSGVSCGRGRTIVGLVAQVEAIQALGDRIDATLRALALARRDADALGIETRVFAGVV